MVNLAILGFLNIPHTQVLKCKCKMFYCHNSGWKDLRNSSSLELRNLRSFAKTPDLQNNMLLSCRFNCDQLILQQFNPSWRRRHVFFVNFSPWCYHHVIPLKAYFASSITIHYNVIWIFQPHLDIRVWGSPQVERGQLCALDRRHVQRLRVEVVLQLQQRNAWSDQLFIRNHKKKTQHMLHFQAWDSRIF